MDYLNNVVPDRNGDAFESQPTRPSIHFAADSCFTMTTTVQVEPADPDDCRQESKAAGMDDSTDSIFLDKETISDYGKESGIGCMDDLNELVPDNDGGNFNAQRTGPALYKRFGLVASGSAKRRVRMPLTALICMAYLV